MTRLDAITLKQLRALAAIERAGSLTAASERLNVTTPAVSTQLRLLEEHIGSKLLTRGPSGHVKLTDEGRIVLETVHAIEQTLDRCMSRVIAQRDGKSGQVAIGVVSTGKYFAPALLKKAQDVMPGIEFSLRIGNRDQIRLALSEETIDLAIMGRPPREPAVEAMELGDHPYVLIAAPDHPLAQVENVSPNDLLDQTFLCREPGSGTRILTERFIDDVGEGRTIKTLELGSNETIKQGVMAGLGIAIISGHTIAHELTSGWLSLLKAPSLPIRRHWFLIRPLSREPSPASLRFETFLLNENGAYLPEIDV